MRYDGHPLSLGWGGAAVELFFLFLTRVSYVEGQLVCPAS